MSYHVLQPRSRTPARLHAQRSNVRLASAHHSNPLRSFLLTISSPPLTLPYSQERHLFHLHHLDTQHHLHGLIYALRASQWRRNDKLKHNVGRLAARYTRENRVRTLRNGSRGRETQQETRERINRRFGNFTDSVDCWRVEAAKWQVEAARYREQEGNGVDEGVESEMTEEG